MTGFVFDAWGSRMTGTKTVPVDEMMRKAMEDALFVEDEVKVEAVPDGVQILLDKPNMVCLNAAAAPYLFSVLKQSEEDGRGIRWVLETMVSWLDCRSLSDTQGFDEDGLGVNEACYLNLRSTFPSLNDFQHFELRRYGKEGAELAVAGGVDEVQDLSCDYFPIQRWAKASFPWSEDEEKTFRVWAGRVYQPGMPNWMLMLPQDY